MIPPSPPDNLETGFFQKTRFLALHLIATKTAVYRLKNVTDTPWRVSTYQIVPLAVRKVLYLLIIFAIPLTYHRVGEVDPGYRGDFVKNMLSSAKIMKLL